MTSGSVLSAVIWPTCWPNPVLSGSSLLLFAVRRSLVWSVVVLLRLWANTVGIASDVRYFLPFLNTKHSSLKWAYETICRTVELLFIFSIQVYKLQQHHATPKDVAKHRIVYSLRKFCCTSMVEAAFSSSDHSQDLVGWYLWPTSVSFRHLSLGMQKTTTRSPNDSNKALPNSTPCWFLSAISVHVQRTKEFKVPGHRSQKALSDGARYGNEKTTGCKIFTL